MVNGEQSAARLQHPNNLLKASVDPPGIATWREPQLMGTQNPGNQVYRAAGRLQFVKIGCAECDVESGGTVIVCIAGKALKSRRILR